MRITITKFIKGIIVFRCADVSKFEFLIKRRFSEKTFKIGDILKKLFPS